MPLPRIQFPASHFTWPLDMYSKIGEASGFQQPQVVGSYGSSGDEGFASNFMGMFGNIMQEQQQRQVMQRQSQQEAQAVQSMVPTLKSMGYDINTINSLFKVNPNALLQQGMSETAFAHHQQLEIQKQQALHDQEIQQNMLTPQQMHAVDQYKSGNMSWDDLNQVIPYDKVGKAMELSSKGLELQKNAVLAPLEEEQKRQSLLHQQILNKYLDSDQKANLAEKQQRIEASKDSVQNANTRVELSKASHQLQQDKFQYDKYRDLYLKKNQLNQSAASPKLLKNGLTQNNFKIYNNLTALNDGSMDSAQRMFQAARKAGVNAPPPGPLTDGGKYLKIVQALLKNKSIDDSSVINTLKTKKAGVDKQISNESNVVNQLKNIEQQLKNPKTTDAQALQLVKKADSLQKQTPIVIAGHKISAEEYAKYQSYDPEKKKRFIQFLVGKGR